MATQLNYLYGFDVVTALAWVNKVIRLDGDRWDIELNETCFYPRGGGQDWDRGMIVSGDAVLGVDEVRLDNEGIVHHLGTMRSGVFVEGQEAACAVDAERRIVNSRLHSAGHVIDMAVDHLGFDWVPGRGAHYPDMTFVEYDGKWSADDAEQLRARIEGEANRVVERGGANEIRFMPKSDMQTVCRFVPEYVPAHKPGRVVIYGGDFGIPCGGTHVKNLKEVGQVIISKVKKKGKAIRVSYGLAA